MFVSFHKNLTNCLVFFFFFCMKLTHSRYDLTLLYDSDYYIFNIVLLEISIGEVLL